ncbi:MAG: energy-coupling factor ABC transporter ATP-binding protein [Candidatus Eiseniibacteriota bacterium]
MNAVDVVSLSFRYPDGTLALQDVSFSVAPGERVALIGPNGAGKSTVLLHLNGLLPERFAEVSAVHVFGAPVADAALSEIRAKVGFLFQDPDDQLFCATVFEDVAFGPRQAGVEGDALRERVGRALDAVGLAGFERRPPHRLSRGEKHRVCLAGLLACEPKVLALDEPTSHLDPRGRRELLRHLRALPVTQIVASHDLELVVELCSRAVLLDGGRIVAEGASEELLADEPLMLAHGLERPHILLHRHPHGRG